jgi:hypothetical protein
VSEVAADDVWAVGTTGPLGAQQPLILHWDGSRWSVVPGAPEVTSGWLASVDAVSTDDVWAVGSGSGVVAVEHWDGRAWSVVHTPPLLRHDAGSSLESVSFSSPANGWALGTSCGTGQPWCRSGALHWNGRRWHRQALPQSAESMVYSSVVALSPTDAWAVGQDGLHGDGQEEPSAAHWDGKAWTVASVPPADKGELESVVAVDSNDVWAFGDYRDGRWVRPLAAHFDGSAWTLSAMPTGRGAHTFVHGGVAIGANDVWAAGATGKTTFERHWDGTNWS